ncbi:MAG: GatB/YqeY domain-containing protein [Clostridia bacterium]
MILEEIKKANFEALKSKNENARVILGMLASRAKMAEISKREKNEPLTETDLVQILQKTSKELSEEAENYAKANNKDEQAKILLQQKICEGFLPKMMTEQEIFAIISAMEDKSVPTVMKRFKSEFAGKCDMRLVQEALKKVNA